MTRKPAVANQFYPGNRSELQSTIGRFTPEVAEKTSVLGALIPHAGYVFCGRVAGKVFGSINIPSSIVLLNPSHHYCSPAFALWTGGGWQTPLGELELHEGICSALGKLPAVSADDRPHIQEHSGEVVLPFLQYHRPDVRIAVICVTSSAGLDELLELGRSIADVLKEQGQQDAIVVASSDMSHESGSGALDVVRRNDALAIEKMEQLDPEGLFDTCRKHHITMCGVLPAVAMMESVRARGGSRGELLDRATSADSPYGRGSYIVGYAGMVFS